MACQPKRSETVVIHELLAFVQQKLDVMDQVSLEQILMTSFTEDKIIQAKNVHWVFQQDLAPAHRAKSTQDWLAARETDFIRHEDWPSSSPDLNPLDYKIWQQLEEKACSKPHPNSESRRY
ncbi:unnamed protein product [Parnassius mnemosyne]|uniref:Tc1-like transposase DDE domain-containing protein n=1 Tax=Parnassius mnemosyne TaxID=213953 RepID=A0AAV1KI79_9NEOP